MKTRIMGRTGLEVSILGLGGFHMLEVGAAEVASITHAFLDAGGNYIESAAEYGDGESERKFGQVISTRRAECVLTTKCHARESAATVDYIERSLRNLRTDHVDILFMHHVQSREELDQILSPINGAIKAAEAARCAGKVRFVGISNHGHPEILMEALQRYPFDVIMTNFSYYDRFNFPLIEDELLPMALNRGCGIVGMKALGDGYLWRSAEKAFRYAWSLPIHTMAAGMNTLGYLEMDLAYAEQFEPMMEEEKEQWFLEAPELTTYVCRQCDQCLPCPENVNIPGIFTLEGIFDRQMGDGVIRNPEDYWLRNSLRFWFENEERARSLFQKLTVKTDACTACGDCEPRCPYHLPIVDKLRRTHLKLTSAELMY
jgi:predicted aldo/keto reductase-like oxidoreductase